jgi:hypothetical protein
VERDSLLTENQARHLRISFGRLLAEAEELAEWISRLPRPEPAWAGGVMAELEHLARAVRAASAELGLDLQRGEVDAGRRVAAWAGVWWASVLDCRPAALRGYGPVDPRLEHTLGPYVEEIAARLRHIGSLADSTRREDSA